MPAASANPPARVLLASLIGTTIEFFDFYIYATAAVLVFPKLFFPVVGSGGGDAAVAGHFCAGVLRAARGFRRVRALRRPHRPQGDAGRGAADHGIVDGAHRIAADLCIDRRAGARCCWRCAGSARDSAWAGSGAERCCWPRRMHRPASSNWYGMFPAARRADRVRPFQRRLPAADALPLRRAVHAVGMARALPRQLGAGAGRAVGAAAHRGDAGDFRIALQKASACRADCRGVAQSRPDGAAGHIGIGGDLCGVLPDDGVLRWAGAPAAWAIRARSSWSCRSSAWCSSAPESRCRRCWPTATIRASVMIVVAVLHGASMAWSLRRCSARVTRLRCCCACRWAAH